MKNIFLLKGGYKIFGGLYLGWGIGANNAANIFSTAVATYAIRYGTAVILIAIFVTVGAMAEGTGLFLSNSTKFSQEATPNLALIATLSAAVTINIITYLSIPTSTSQAAIGAFMGIAIASSGLRAVAWSKFSKMMICWIFHPIIGLVLCIVLIKTLYPLFDRFIKSTVAKNRTLKVCFVIFGCYGAYALGANNVVVTTSSYYQAGMFGAIGTRAAALWAAAIGGVSIALGALTYGRKVMVTIGKRITPLDPFSALIVVLVHSMTLHFFTQLNVPVSSSHAVVGAVIGAGLLHGVRTVNKNTLIKIFAGWITTPLVSALLAYSIARLLNLAVL